MSKGYSSNHFFLKKKNRAFREVCHCILTSVRERYPEAKYTAVGAFIFLRFFCPAIVSPESEGLIKPNIVVSRDMKRGHLIATKVIQNLANNVLFGAKETFMIVFNDFVTGNIYKVTNFLREISNVPPPKLDTNGTPEYLTPEIRPMEDKDYSCLHRVLADNLERISRELATRRIRQATDQERSSVWKRQFDAFLNLMARLGRPPEISKQEFSGLRSYTFAAANQLYAEFMRRNSHRSVDSIVSKNIFYEGGVSKANRPVFYFITRNIVADSIDFELLVYHMLQVYFHLFIFFKTPELIFFSHQIMERAQNKSLELIVDTTLFSGANEIPNQWVNQILQLLPFDAYDNISNILVYNPNSHLRKYVKKLPRPLTHKMAKRIVFAVTLAELYEYVNPSEIRLPKSTSKFIYNPNTLLLTLLGFFSIFGY
jgi:neurofibromin 1